MHIICPCQSGIGSLVYPLFQLPGTNCKMAESVGETMEGGAECGSAGRGAGGGGGKWGWGRLLKVCEVSLKLGNDCFPR